MQWSVPALYDRLRSAPRRRRSPILLAPADEVLRHRGDENQAEQDLRGGRRIADVPAVEANLVDEQDDRTRGIVRAALRHQLRLAEQLELQHDLDYQHEHQRAPDRWQRDAPQRLPASGMVERR